MAISLSPVRERALLITLMALQVITIVDFTILMPLSPRLMAEFDIQPAQFGFLVSSYSIAAGVSSLIASSLGDRFDRRSALLVCYSGLLIGTFACAYATSYELLLAARIIAGFFAGLLSSIVLPIVGDVFPQEKRGRATAVVMMALPLASVAGVPLGLIISNHFSWQTPFIFLAITGLLLEVVAYKVVPSVRDHMDQPRVNFLQSYVDVFSVPNHWWAFLTSGVTMFAGFMVTPYLAQTIVANVGMTDAQLPYIYLAGGIATLITRPIIGRMTDKYNHSNMLTVITLTSFVPIILVTQTFHTPIYVQIIFTTLFTVCVSGRFIPASAIMTGSCESRYRGRVMAFSAAVQNLGSGLAVVIGGMLIVKTPTGEVLHYDWVGYLACAVSFIAIWASRKVKAVS